MVPVTMPSRRTGSSFDFSSGQRANAPAMVVMGERISVDEGVPDACPAGGAAAKVTAERRTRPEKQKRTRWRGIGFTLDGHKRRCRKRRREKRRYAPNFRRGTPGSNVNRRWIIAV